LPTRRYRPADEGWGRGNRPGDEANRVAVPKNRKNLSPAVGGGARICDKSGYDDAILVGALPSHRSKPIITAISPMPAARKASIGRGPAPVLMLASPVPAVRASAWRRVSGVRSKARDRPETFGSLVKGFTPMKSLPRSRDALRGEPCGEIGRVRTVRS